MPLESHNDENARSQRVVRADEMVASGLADEDQTQTLPENDCSLLSPEEFYRQFISRPDIRGLLARLAKR